MIPPPPLPPVFRPLALDGGDMLAAASSRAAAGAEPGTLAWAARRDRLDVAVVLAPDRPLAETRRVIAVAAVALADALDALGPPNLLVGFSRPDRILVNGAVAGILRFAAPPGTAEAEVPEWAVVGAAVDVLGDPEDDSPGRHPDRTALREEGFGEVDAPALLESFARHFVSWLDIWDDAGFQPVLRIWERRLDRAGGPDGRDPWTVPNG